MTDKARRVHPRGDAGDTSAAGGGVTGPIGEVEADEFAGDVVAASGEETVAHEAGGVPGAAGGGTGSADLAGGTGIGPGGTDDMAGNEGPGAAGR